MTLFFVEDAEQAEAEALARIDVPELWDPEVVWTWRSLAILGFPEYVVFRDGRVMRLLGGGCNLVEVKKHYSGTQKRTITVVLHKLLQDKEGQVTERKQVAVRNLVGHAFVPRPEGSRQLGAKDGDLHNLSAENLYWK